MSSEKDANISPSEVWIDNLLANVRSNPPSYLGKGDNSRLQSSWERKTKRKRSPSPSKRSRVRSRVRSRDRSRSPHKHKRSHKRERKHSRSRSRTRSSSRSRTRSRSRDRSGSRIPRNCSNHTSVPSSGGLFSDSLDSPTKPRNRNKARKRLVESSSGATFINMEMPEEQAAVLKLILAIVSFVSYNLSKLTDRNITEFPTEGLLEKVNKVDVALCELMKSLSETHQHEISSIVIPILSNLKTENKNNIQWYQNTILLCVMIQTHLFKIFNSNQISLRDFGLCPATIPCRNMQPCKYSRCTFLHV